MPADNDFYKWKRCQLSWYIEKFPLHKPKEIISWLASHQPHPWPDCTAKEISRWTNQIKRKLEQSPRLHHSFFSLQTKVLCANIKPFSQNLSIDKLVTSVMFEPLLITWDSRIPRSIDVHAWRRIQLKRYLEVFPEHKPKKIMAWLSSHKTHP